MITVANRIFVDAAYAEAFEARFRDRAGLVDQMPGFIANQVLRPVNDGDPYVVLTLWESRAHFEAWLPREAFPKPNVLEVHEVIQDSSRPELPVEPRGGPLRFH
jgi:heme oxygenase (mycobilin-producing)